jgi:protocatechuate 3,4-dioxygenase beta subunit
MVERSNIITAAATVAAIALLSGPGLGAAGASAGAQAEPRFTDVEAQESPAMRGLIDKAKAYLAAGRSAEDLIVDPHFVPAHEYPRFRDLIREHPSVGHASLVTPEEAGTPLTVSGVVRDAAGNAVKGALIYAYQTSAKGWYSDRAPHYASPSGDEKHARLFTYLTTDEKGAYELRTVRPAGYPGSDLPGHIHVEITPPGGGARVLVTEVRFEDDPRMTPSMKEQSSKEGFLIANVMKVSQGGLHVTADFTLR